MEHNSQCCFSTAFRVHYGFRFQLGDYKFNLVLVLITKSQESTFSHHLKKQAQRKNSFNCCMHKYLNLGGKRGPVPSFRSTTSFLSAWSSENVHALLLDQQVQVCCLRTSPGCLEVASVYLAPMKHLCPLEISGSTLDKDQCEFFLPTCTSVLSFEIAGACLWMQY